MYGQSEAVHVFLAHICCVISNIFFYDYHECSLSV